MDTNGKNNVFNQERKVIIMEDMILIVIRALAILGTKGIHSILDSAGNAVLNSPNKIDDELFKMVIDSVKSYTPKNE